MAKTFDRNAYRRAMHWLAKPIRTVTVTVDGQKRKLSVLRKVKDDMRPWITQDTIDRHSNECAARNK